MTAAFAESSPLALYADVLGGFPADSGHSGWRLRDGDGGRRPLDLLRWCSTWTAGDDGLLDRCAGATLDLSLIHI